MIKYINPLFIKHSSFIIPIVLLVLLFTSCESSPEAKMMVKFGNEDTLAQFPKKWKYHSGDDMNWAKPNYNDSTWQLVNPELDLDSIRRDLFTGICWFRIPFKISPKYINQILQFTFDHNGASEFYIDGKQIGCIGTVANNVSEETPILPKDSPVLFSLTDTNCHTLSIRYSNQLYHKLYQKYDEAYLAGIKNLKYRTHTSDGKSNESISTKDVFIFLVTFFATLSFVHFLLFLFYRKNKQNLFYSVFVLVFSLTIMLQLIYQESSSPDLAFLSYQYFIIFLNLLFPSLTLFLYSIFKPKSWKGVLRGLAFSSIVCIILYFSDFLSTFSCIVIFSLTENFRSIIYGLKHKINGAKIIGTGFLFFYLLITYVFLLFFVKENLDEGLLVELLVLLSIISIPVSMSIYLAREFSSTNKSLTAQLKEVEALSEKTIAQEKEKQAILALQKEKLEVQVQERTQEIRKQKHELEEKNQEITDSINYAQKIQHTLMASDKLLDDNLKKADTTKDYFMLYKPKDIVSGDYYWAYKPEHENSFILITADCTGHGVPGAFMSLLCISYLNEVVKEQGITQPDKIFNLVRDKIVNNFKANESNERKDGMDAVIYKLNYDTNVLEYAAANNPIIVLEPNDNNLFELVELKADKMPVGVTHDGIYKPFTYGEYKLKPNSMIYTFTDGYADQFGGLKGKKFMYKQMRELFLSCATISVQEQKETLNTVIENWKNGIEQVDDMLIVGVRY